MSETWIIEPRDPLIARDGRAFDATPGARAVSLPFPFPSTLAGALRTRAGTSKEERGYFDGSDTALIAAVKKIEVLGPLLVEIGDDGSARPLVPAPADALLTNDRDDKEKVFCKRLLPLQRETGDWCDLDGDAENPAALVGIWQPDAQASKPYDRAPRFWNWETFAAWLLPPSVPLAHQPIDVEKWGHGGAAAEARSHVAIDDATLTHREGALFQTRGLRFSHRDQQRNPYGRAQRLGLMLRVDKLGDLKIGAGIAPLGGERRLMAWQRAADAGQQSAWPAMPSQVLAAIAERGACRVHLLTPAYFQEGWRPKYLLRKDDETGVQPELVAASLGRLQTVSGWDFQARAPKPSRRLVPAGAVYFLRLGGDTSEEARRAWAQKMWLQAVSDDPLGEDAPARSDGFGLAALGAWSGNLAEQLKPLSNAEVEEKV